MAVETLKRDEIAKELNIAPGAVTAMIINGTLPIGCAYDNGETTRTVIIKTRWEKWRDGRDLGT